MAFADKINLVKTGANPTFLGTESKEKCTDPWACHNWLKHCVCPHGCEKIRNNQLSQPNIGFATQEEAIDHVKKYILTWCIAVWSHGGMGSMGIDTVIYYGSSANPWLVSLVKEQLRPCFDAYLETVYSTNDYWNESVRQLFARRSKLVEMTFCAPRHAMMS